MALAIVHSTVATLPDEAGAEVNKAEWNANHSVSGTVAAADVTGLATVATSGAYSDLSGKPALAAVATSGLYSDLSGTPTLVSGVYTPIIVIVANLDVTGTTAYECQYMRVGSVVTVSGKVDVNPTLTATSTQLGIPLPIASNFGAAEDCAGVAFASAVAGMGGAILGDATNDRAQLQFVSSDINSQPMYFSFQYQVI